MVRQEPPLPVCKSATGANKENISNNFIKACKSIKTQPQVHTCGEIVCITTLRITIAINSKIIKYTMS